MFSITRIVTLVALAAVSSATAIVERAPPHHLCPGAKVEHTSTVDIGNGDAVTATTYQCAPRAASLVRRTTVNVCGASCTIACNSITGILPPISDDCAKISAAIQIFQGITTTFTVAPDHQMTLTFGTCSYFFDNFGSSVTYEYCYSDLNTTAIADGAACFPPVQPFFPEGLCTSSDGTWAVGASHS